LRRSGNARSSALDLSDDADYAATVAATAAETDLSRHPIVLFAEWMDGGVEAAADEPAVVVCGWRVPLSVIEQWHEGTRTPAPLWSARSEASVRTRWDVAWDVVDIAWRVLCYSVAAVILWVVLWGFVIGAVSSL
jgi:hypothetical protein